MGLVANDWHNFGRNWCRRRTDFINKKIRYNPTNFPPVESFKRKLEILSVVILLIGLVLEVLALPHSLLEVAKLEKSNLELQIKLQPRTITPAQIRSFIFFTEKVTKIPIKVLIGQEGDDTETYAVQIREMLNQARFEPDASAELWGITRDSTLLMGRRPDNTQSSPQVIFVCNSTNQWGVFALKAEITNGVARPIYTGNDPTIIYSIIASSFERIGIRIERLTDSALKPREFEIFIPLKNM